MTTATQTIESLTRQEYKYGFVTEIEADMESKILSVPGVEDVEGEVVFDPPWNPDMMSEAAKLELGML